MRFLAIETAQRKSAVDAWLHAYVSLKKNPETGRRNGRDKDAVFRRAAAVGITRDEIRGAAKRLGLSTDCFDALDLPKNRPLVYSKLFSGPKSEAIRNWLVNLFLVRDGILTKDVARLAAQEGFSQATVDLAKTALGIFSVRRDGRWYWAVDDDSFKDLVEAQTETIIDLLASDGNGYGTWRTRESLAEYYRNAARTDKGDADRIRSVVGIVVDAAISAGIVKGVFVEQVRKVAGAEPIRVVALRRGKEKTTEEKSC